MAKRMGERARMFEEAAGSASYPPFALRPPLAPRRGALEEWWRGLDRLSLALFATLALVGVGLSLAASPPLAERNGLLPFHYAGRQALFAALAFMALLLFSMAPRVWLVGSAGLLLAAGTAGLALLPFMGADYGKGAVRWLAAGGFSLQPSEFAKPAAIVICGAILERFAVRNPRRGAVFSLLLLAVIVCLLWIQPDHGQMALLFLAWLVMLFVSGAALAWLFLACVAGFTTGALVWYGSANVRARVEALLVETPAPNSQLALSLHAFETGGMTGVGPSEGVIKYSLPDAYTDFVIAVAAEEFGAIAALSIAGLFAFLTIRAFWRIGALAHPDLRTIGAGLAALIGLQALVNIAVAVHLLPPTGMTLPFVSYGGSSLLATGIGAGWLLACTRAPPASGVEGALEEAGTHAGALQ